MALHISCDFNVSPLDEHPVEPWEEEREGGREREEEAVCATTLHGAGVTAVML